MERFTAYLGSALAVVILLFVFFLGSASSKLKPPIEVAISRGAGFREIADSLYRQGIVRSRRAFIVYGALIGAAHQLKPGKYFFSPASSTPAIFRQLVRGPLIEKSVIIPPGATLKDIDSILSASSVLKLGGLSALTVYLFRGQYKFLADAGSLEGFLFPDTYKFFLSSQPAAVAKKMLENFEKKAQPLFDERQATSDPSTRANLGTGHSKRQDFIEKLIIASLLEKEAPDFEDRRLIAGVLYKRMSVGIGLQVDATITYIKCRGYFITCPNPKVLRSDLQLQSPYNTYLYRGLPPGPIGNPGLEAMKAALQPKESEYWYYLSDPKTKKTIFSRTLEEHNENRARYLGI